MVMFCYLRLGVLVSCCFALTALVMMKEAFTLGYIQMIDGEKDPRNLMSIFQLTQAVIHNFPFGESFYILNRL
mgnify:CR=1 FL=1